MSKWRDEFKVHPAADVFPMMSEEELDKLGKDIKANELREGVTLWFPDDADEDTPGLLLDGRNRLDACERAGVEPHVQHFQGDPVAYIISANIRRRHLSKQQQADLIVAAHRASRQVGEVPPRHVKGKAGSEKDATKGAAVATAKEHGISKRTIERSFAKAEDKTPKPKPKPKPKSEPKATITVTMPAGIDAARKHYVLEFVDLSPAKRRAEWDKLLKAVEKAADEAS
jgi:hypothetical protein